MKLAKEKTRLEEDNKSYKRKVIVSIIILVIGMAVLCCFLGLIQKRAAEERQRDSSTKVLEEVKDALSTNDAVACSIEDEFNSLNQSTIGTIKSYLDSKNTLEVIGSSISIDEFFEVFNDLNIQFVKLGEELAIDSIYFTDDHGLIMASSWDSTIGYYLSDVLPQEDVDILLRYEKEGNEIVSNGTVSSDGSIIPVSSTYDGDNFLSYSTFYGEANQTGFYIILSVSQKFLDKELGSIKQIDSILDGVPVGKTGFLFAVDKETKSFMTYNNGSTDLTGESYEKHGFSDKGIGDDYAGYQVIDGIKYYCVTQDFKSETYGDFVVIAAVVSEKELVSSNLTVVLISCFIFIAVACVVAGYGIIINHDMAEDVIKLESRLTIDLKEESEDGNLKFTDEEIKERVKIRVSETIEKKTDKKLETVLLGVRNKKGVQTHISLYMVKKIFPVIIVGILLIFGMSFFSQTLLVLQDVINVSSVRIQEIKSTLDKNSSTANTITNYVEEQYLTKAKLISFLLEESPENAMDYRSDSNDIHLIYNQDENGERYYLYDMYENRRYSSANNEYLEKICQDNGIKAIYIYDDEGYVISTNTKYWYDRIGTDESSRIYSLNDVLFGKESYIIEKVDHNDDSKEHDQFIGYRYFYYTYFDDGKTVYTSAANYRKQQEGTWDKDEITKHSSLIEIEIASAEFDALFEVTKLSYVLKHMHVYGEESYFMAFDSTSDHICIYSPNDASIGKSASELGYNSDVFKLNGSYNGFISVDGSKYYQTFILVDGIYYSTVIPTSSIYSTRNGIALYTVLFSGIFIILSSAFFTVSSDKADREYVEYIKHKDETEYGSRIGFNGELITKFKPSLSVSARYSKIIWKNKTVEQKLGTIIMGYFNIAAIFIIIVTIKSLVDKDNDSIFKYVMSHDWDRGVNIFSITESLMIIVLVITITTIVKGIVKSFCSSLGTRVATLGNLLVSVVRYGGMLGGFFYCLYLFGFDTGSLITSAGILTIVVGLGAQSLISDILAGMFIVFEGEFRVGDIVTIGDFRGQVLEIGLRTTKLKDLANNVKIFNNSSISGVLNMTKESSYACVTVGIEYGENLERVEKVLHKGFHTIRKKLPAITDGPFYRGVMSLNTSSVDIGIIATCAEEDRVQLARDLNREILLLFNKNHINIPFPQVTVSYLNGDSDKPADESKGKAE